MTETETRVIRLWQIEYGALEDMNILWDTQTIEAIDVVRAITKAEKANPDVPIRSVKFLAEARD